MVNSVPLSRLWIDESGKFKVKNDLVVVGGLLDRRPISNHLVRTSLREQAPGCPWPLHAAHYRLPVAIALSNHTSRVLDLLRVNEWLDPAAKSAVEVLSRHAPEATRLVLDEMEAGRLVDYDVMVNLDRLLARSAGEPPYTKVYHARLWAARDRLVAAVSEVLKVIADLELGSGIISSEQKIGTAGTSRISRLKIEGLGPSETDRYLALLGGAVRAACRQTRKSKSATILVKPVVLSRPMHDMRALTTEDVDRVVRQADCPETFTASEVRSYDSDTHSCHVLADFIANAARRGLRTARGVGIAREVAVNAELRIAVECEWVAP